MNWSKKHPECKKCKTTERRHEAKGLCRRCYDAGRKGTNLYKAKTFRYRQKRRVLRRIESMEKSGWWHHLGKQGKLVMIRHPKTGRIVPTPVLKNDKFDYDSSLAIEMYRKHLDEETNNTMPRLSRKRY